MHIKYAVQWLPDALADQRKGVARGGDTGTAPHGGRQSQVQWRRNAIRS